MRPFLFSVFAFVLAWTPVRAAGTREAYVWQRQFDRGVVDAMRVFAPQLDGLCLLAAEVAWKNGKIDIVRPSVDFRAVAQLNQPIGLAIRLGDYPGAFASDDVTARTLVQLARGILTQAKAAGVTVRELQIDYDCAESKLAGYRQWLVALRAPVTEANARLAITALPVWLKHRDFAALVRATDGFVLQVHSLVRPKSPDEPFTLCDPAQALVWARAASAAGVPFRVALPTYGYALAFDSKDKFLGLAAEGPAPSWPPGTHLRVVAADPVAMARLGADLLAAPPPHCTGVIWFRLPVARDRYNWDAKTFAVVLRGEIPVARLVAKVDQPEPGLVEIVIANTGETTEPLPTQVQLKWPAGARVLASDGLSGFRLDFLRPAAQANVHAADVTADASITPGREVRIAWLRFAHATSVEVSLAAAP